LRAQPASSALTRQEDAGTELRSGRPPACQQRAESDISSDSCAIISHPPKISGLFNCEKNDSDFPIKISHLNICNVAVLLFLCGAFKAYRNKTIAISEVALCDTAITSFQANFQKRQFFLDTVDSSYVVFWVML